MYLLIYSEKSLPRLHYACHVAWACMSQVPHQFTTSLPTFNAYQGPKIWYGTAAPTDIPLLPYSPLLESSSLLDCIALAEAIDLPHLEPAAVSPPQISNSTTHPPDYLGAIFYAVSRLEEYEASPLSPPSTPTIATRFKGARLLKECGTGPFVHAWVQALNATLPSAALSKTPLSTTSSRPLTIARTLDIDNAFAYLHKGPARWLGSLAKDIAQSRWQMVRSRLATTFLSAKDPYDTHAEILAWYTAQKAKNPTEQLHVFILSAIGKHPDRPVPLSSPAMRQIVKAYAEAGCTIGLHPTVHGGQSLKSLRAEKDALEHVLGQSIMHTRHHYLVYGFPHTPRLLLEAGFTHCHTLGFSHLAAYRAGISVPFPYYDFTTEAQTALTLHPFSWMDTTYLQNPSLGNHALAQQHAALTPFGGNLVTVHHNEYWK
jgi:hypothetical protein